MERPPAEEGGTPFSGAQRGMSKIGMRVLDSRMSIISNPMDPRGGYLPFNVWSGEPYYPTTWIDRGVLRTLAYPKDYALSRLGKNYPCLNPRSWHISGGPTSVDEMIAGTTRGLLVTRFFNVRVTDAPSATCTGYTRDGLWLIEHGKISKPVQNFRFTESPLFAFNNVEQLGPEVRVYSGETYDLAWIAPTAKVLDFNFTQLSNAV